MSTIIIPQHSPLNSIKPELISPLNVSFALSNLLSNPPVENAPDIASPSTQLAKCPVTIAIPVRRSSKTKTPVSTIPGIGRDGVGIQLPSARKAAAEKEYKGGVKRQRKRVNTAEKRASHNAVERQRRETLNSKFLDLARALPTLASLRRPSKSSIVNGSLHHLNLSREQRLLASKELRTLYALNQHLLEEVNNWRGRNGMPLRLDAAWTPGCEEVVGVESEVFGTFDGGMGADDDGDGDDDEDMTEERDDQTNHASLDLEAEDVSQGVDMTRRSSSNTSNILNVDEASVIAAAVAADGHRLSSHYTSNGNVQFHQSFFNTADTDNRGISYASGISGSPSFPSYMSGQFQGQQSTSGQIQPGGAIARQHHLNALAAEAYSKSQQNPYQTQYNPNPLTYQSLYAPQHSPVGRSHTGSVGGGDIMTPPPQFGTAHTGVSYLESPPLGVAATSFSLGVNQGDKVSDWAAQQMLLQFGIGASQASGGQSAAFCESLPSANTPGQHFHGVNNGTGYRADEVIASLSNQYNPRNSLVATHQSLLAHQPHLAAAAFPSPIQSPSSLPAGPGSHRDSASPPDVNPQSAHPHGMLQPSELGLGISAETMAEWKSYALGNFLNNPNRPSGRITHENLKQQALHVLESRGVARNGMSMGMAVGNGWTGSRNTPPVIQN